MPIYRNINLSREHESKAILIKLLWIFIAGLCSIVAATLWQRDDSSFAFMLGNIGSVTWLVSSLCLVIVATIWLQAHIEASSIATIIGIAAWGITTLCLISVVYLSARSGMTVMFISAKLGLVAWIVVSLWVVNRLRKSPDADVAFVCAWLDAVAWIVACTSLFSCAVLWFLRKEWNAAFISLVMSSVAGTIVYTSLEISYKLRSSPDIRSSFDSDPEVSLGSSDTETSLSLDSEVIQRSSDIKADFISDRIDLVAWVIVASCVACFIIFWWRTKIGTAFVAAMIGMVAGFISTRITIKRKFEDTIPVYNATMGTQFVHPIVVLSKVDVQKELLKIKEFARRCEATESHSDPQ